MNSETRAMQLVVEVEPIEVERVVLDALVRLVAERLPVPSEPEAAPLQSDLQTTRYTFELSPAIPCA